MKERRPIIIIRARVTIGGRHVYSSDTVYTCGLTGYWRLVVIARVHAVTRANAPLIPSMRKRLCVSARARMTERTRGRVKDRD